MEKGLSVTKPICDNVSESTIVCAGTRCGHTGWLEFGLAVWPGTGGGQESGGAEYGRGGQILDPSKFRESGAEDRVMANTTHTSGGSPHKKQQLGSHSRKKWAVPVDAWPVSNNILWGTPRKNTGSKTKALHAGSILLSRLHMLGVYCC